MSKETFRAELAKRIPVDKIYGDLFQPALSEAGKGLQGAVKLALSPISAMVWGYDKIAEYLDIAMPEYFAKRKISKEKIFTGDIAVVVPVVEAMRYMSDKTIIRNLFINLLGATMNRDTTDSVHPAFVEIIKQLSTNEASLITKILDTYVVMADYEAPTQAGTVSGYNVCAFEHDNLGISIDNLIRLGIYEKVSALDILQVSHFPDIVGKIYKSCSDDIDWGESLERTIDRFREIVIINYYQLKPTELGNVFVQLCLDEDCGAE